MPKEFLQQPTQTRMVVSAMNIGGDLSLGVITFFEEFKLEWVDPIKGASPLQESDTGGAVRQDKSDIWNEYVKNHSADLPQWWVEQRK